MRFVPELWSTVYFEWMHKIKDWCISRQLWWGHRIPAWYDPEGKWYVARSEAQVRAQYGIAADVPLRQDEDVLDYCPRAVFGGVVTALWLFLILKTGRAFMDMTKLEQVIGCVQEHGGMFRYLPDGLPGLKGPDIALSNKVIVRAVPSTGKLIGYVEILGMLQIGGIFAGGGAKGFAVEHIYVHDVLGKKDRSAEYAIDPAIFDRQDWRTVGLGPTVGDGPALEAHFSERLQSVFVHRYHERFAATDPAPET